MANKCKCWEIQSELLREKGFKFADGLTSLVFIKNTLGVRHHIPVQRIDGKRLRRSDAKAVLISHCPFCGAPFEDINNEGNRNG